MVRVRVDGYVAIVGHPMDDIIGPREKWCREHLEKGTWRTEWHLSYTNFVFKNPADATMFMMMAL